MQEIETTLSDKDKLYILEETVTRHPLNRELMYKILAHCAQEYPLECLEKTIATWPEFNSSTQNQYHLLETLTKAYGLQKYEYDENGVVVTSDSISELNDDEIDELIYETRYLTTDTGQLFVQKHHPRARIVELLSLAPERTDVYIELLEYISEEPRTYNQIKQLLGNHPALEIYIEGQSQVMQPSVFVDKLERAGALVWDKGWCLSEEGNIYLQDLKKGK